MNGKIKTKFAALFAVALMITVCVVPMVGNDYGEAETVIIPTGDNELKEVTVEGYVYNANEEGIKGAKITIEGGLETDGIVVYTDSSGKYSAVVEWIKDTTNASADLTVTLDKDTSTLGTGEDAYANPAYGLFTSDNSVLEFEKVTTEKITGVNFKAGYVTITGKLYYANGNADKGLWDGSADLTLKQVKTSVEPKEYDDVDDAVISYSNGIYIINVKANTALDEGYDKFVVKADGFTDSSMFDIKTSNVTGMDLKSNNLYLMKLKTDSLIDDDLQVNAVEKSKVTLSLKSYTIDKDTTKDIIGTFTVNDSDDTLTNMKVNISGDYGKPVEATVSTSGITELNYKQTNYISGTVKMGDVPANTGDVEITFYKEDDSTISVSPNTAPVNGGAFEYWYVYDDVVEAAEYQVTYDETEGEAKSFDAGDKYDKNTISVPSTGFQKISGKITSAVSSGVSGIEITIDSAEDCFGLDSSDVIVTSADGTYSFMAPVGTILTITPDDEFVYDIASVQIEVMNKAISGINFVIGTKDVDFTLIDNASMGSVAIEGAEIFYTLDTSVEKPVYTKVVTDSDGKAKLTLNANADLSKAGYYVVIKDRVSAVNAEDPFETDELSITVDAPLDNKYMVDFLTGNTTSMDLPAVYVGSIDTTPGSYHIYDLEFVTEMIGIEDDTQAYFMAVAPAADESFYLYSESGMVGKYYFKDAIEGKLVECDFTSSISGYDCEVSLVENVASGKILSASGEPIVGATITLLSDDVVIGSGVTNSMGYYNFANTVAPAGATVKITNAGIYTFADGTYTSGANIIANEGIYESYILDAAENIIVGADITVTSRAFTDGETYTDKVDATGKFSFIAKKDTLYRTYLAATDADGIYTFRDFGFNVADLPDIKYKASETTYTVNVPAEGLTVEIYKFNANTGYELVVGDLVSDKNKEVKVILKKDSNYQSAVESVEFGLQFEGYEAFNTGYEVTISAENSFVSLSLVTKSGSAINTIDDSEYTVKSFTKYGDEYTQVGVAKSVKGTVSIIEGAFYTVEGSAGSLFTFGSADAPYVAATGTSIYANEVIYSGVVSTQNDVPLAGVEVVLKNTAGETIGTGATDAKGEYAIVAPQNAKAFVADTELDIGKFTFPTTGSTGNIKANEYLYSGYYANGAVIDGVEVTYKNATGYTISANVVGAEYYIASTTPINASTEVTATAKNFNASGTINYALEIEDAPLYKVTFEPSGFAQIVGYNASGVAYGTVVTLIAQNEYNSEISPAITDVIQKIKFAGWYVNGEKISDDAVTTYTVVGDCTIVAAFETATSSVVQEDNSNDLSMDVLVLGIVIVILALLAFVYAVKFKKE